MDEPALPQFGIDGRSGLRVHVQAGRPQRFDAKEPDSIRQSRIAHTNIYSDPQEGDEVLIEAVLNVIMEIKKKE